MVISPALYAKLDYIPEPQLIRIEQLAEYDRVIARLLVGTRWMADSGTVWSVIEHDAMMPGYVKVEREFTGETYWWHVKSILETTMSRMSCDLTA